MRGGEEVLMFWPHVHPQSSQKDIRMSEPKLATTGGAVSKQVDAK